MLLLLYLTEPFAFFASLAVYQGLDDAFVMELLLHGASATANTFLWKKELISPETYCNHAGSAQLSRCRPAAKLLRLRRQHCKSACVILDGLRRFRPTRLLRGHKDVVGIVVRMVWASRLDEVWNCRPCGCDATTEGPVSSQCLNCSEWVQWHKGLIVGFDGLKGSGSLTQFLRDNGYSISGNTEI
jgi:hypothetical protein